MGISCLLFELHSIKKLPSLFLEPVGKDLIKNKLTLDSKRLAAYGWLTRVFRNIINQISYIISENGHKFYFMVLDCFLGSLLIALKTIGFCSP